MAGVPIRKAVHLPFSTARTTQREIVELSLLNPAWGPQRIAREIQQSRFQSISPATIHNILAGRGLGSANERAKELYRRHLKGAVLTSLQKEIVRRRVEPAVSWKGPIAADPGSVLTQGIVRTHRDSPLGVARLHVVVDTCDKRTFAMFVPKTAECESLECLTKAIDALGLSVRTIKAIYTDVGDDFTGRRGLPYISFLKEQKIQRRLHETTSNRPNPMANSVWKRLKKHLFEDNYDLCIQHKNRPEGLNLLIREFLLSEAR